MNEDAGGLYGRDWKDKLREINKREIGDIKENESTGGGLFRNDLIDRRVCPHCGYCPHCGRYDGADGTRTRGKGL